MSDSPTEGFDLLSSFQYFFNHGVEEKKTNWNSNSQLMRIINRYMKIFLTDILKELGFEGDYGISARSGSSGRWSNTPYVCIIRGKPNGFNKQYSAERGIYPAYLFSKDCSKIYLSFMIAIGSKNKRDLKKCIETIRNDVGMTSFDYDTDSMCVGDESHLYKEATAFFRCYDKQNPLDIDTIKSDLNEMLIIQANLGSDYYRSLSIIK